MRQKIRIGIFLGWIAYASLLSLSAQLLWNAYKIPRSSQFESIFQDSKGFFWFGNRGTVHRFDGLSWDSFQLADSLKASVSCFAERSNEELWVGLDNGDIYLRKEQNWQKFEPTEGTPQKPITSLLFDENDKLWISTYGEGLYFFDQEKLINIREADGLPSSDLYAAVLGPGNKVWCATDRGVGIVWLQDGEKKVKYLGKEEGLSDLICTSLSRGDDGNIFVGMYDGSIAVFNPMGEKVRQQINCSKYPVNQLLDDGTYTWILDQDGLLWRLDGKKLIQVKTPGIVAQIYLGHQGRIWILGQNNDLFSAPVFISKEIESEFVSQALALGTGGKLWVGTASGLYHTKGSTQDLAPIAKTASLNISSLYVDPLQRIWMGTLGQGLWLYTPSRQELRPISLSGITSKVPILSISGNHQSLWVATFGGAYLCKISKGGQILSKQHFRKAAGLGINYIYQSLTDSSGNSLLATDGNGLGRWENGTLLLDEALIGSSIFSLSTDEEGGIWLLGENGEVLFKNATTCDTLLAFKDQQALAIHAISPERAIVVYQKEVFCINRTTGIMVPLLTENQYSGFGSHLNVWAQGLDGALWLGSPEAILKVDTKKIPKELCPKGEITEVLINLQKQNTTRNSFAHDEKHITFSYAALWYTDPERISFRHRLKGHDLSWVESRNQRVVYADLTPGTYLFELEVGIDGFFDPESKTRYAFEIKKPFWLQPIFLILFLLAILGLLYAVVHYREVQITKTQELMRKSIEHQFETLRSQINPHFLFNAFSTLTNLVEESPDMAVSYINRLSDLFRDMLTHRDQPLISLKEELRIIDNYYALQKERYGENFTLSIDIPSRYNNNKVPPLVLQILVENTLRHNITSKEHPLFVEIFIENEQVIIRNPIKARRSVPDSTKLGIQNIQERYHILTDKKVEISNKDAVFTVKLPLLS